MKKILTILLVVNGFLFAQKTWTGAGDGSNWSDASNWSGSAVPTASDQVLLNNATVSGSYIVYLPATAESIVRLTITPSGSNNITLILPSSNILAVAFTVGDNTSSTDDVIINNGAILKNSSGASTGTPIVVNGTGNGTVRINNGGRYIHNTLRAVTTGWTDRLSSVAGTETGIFEFDVPYTSASSFSPSASGRTYGNLTFSNNSGFAGTYTISGASALIVNGNLTLNSNATLTSSMTGGLTIKGNLTHNGSSLTIPSGQATTLSGSSAQTIGGSNTVTFGGNLTINNSFGITLSTNSTVGGTLTFTSGKITTVSYTLSLGSSASISGEAAGKYVVGTLAMITAVGNGSSSTFGGMGLSLSTAAEDLGNVTVARITGSHVTLNSNTGINRIWSINPTNAITAARDLTLTWNSDDDNGKTLTSVQVWKSTDNFATTGNTSTVGSAVDGSSRSVTVPLASLSSGSNTSFTIAQSDQPLPVELTSFTRSIVGKKVNLNWQTATEINNYGFEIQRLAVGNQPLAKSQELNANSWTKIGFVNGNGNSNSPKNYSFTDEPFGGKEFKYRLKQIDFDGVFEYSDEVTAVFEDVTTFALEQNYPNPFNPVTKISYTIPQRSNVKLRVYNMLAQLEAELVNDSQEAGHYQVIFNGSNLPSGTYFYKLEAGKFVEVKKFLLVK